MLTENDFQRERDRQKKKERERERKKTTLQIANFDCYRKVKIFIQIVLISVIITPVQMDPTLSAEENFIFLILF
jgi:hypothetical protein